MIHRLLTIVFTLIVCLPLESSCLAKPRFSSRKYCCKPVICKRICCPPICCVREPTAVPCICLKEELFSYPTTSGLVSLYVAERHDTGCINDPGNNNCQGPVLVWVNSDPNQSEQFCHLDTCSVRYKIRHDGWLSNRIPYDFDLLASTGADQPQVHKDVLTHMTLIDHDNIEFRANDLVGGPRYAKVFLVKIKQHYRTAGGKTTLRPARIVAIGYEVEYDPNEKYYSVPKSDVQASSQHPWVYSATVGSVKYGVVLTKK